MFPKAIRIARNAHDGQTRRNGEPYILHPLRIANLFSREDVKTVAVLHDVLENTDVKLQRLVSEFGDIVAGKVKNLTQGVGESYEKYIDRIIETGDKDLIEIKVYDIIDNSMGRPTKQQLSKYEKVFDKLIQASPKIAL